MPAPLQNIIRHQTGNNLDKKNLHHWRGRRSLNTEDVKQLRLAALERAAITLERAFAHDPMLTWIFPDSDKRSLSLRVMSRVLLQYGVRYGHATESNDGRAVAIWIPPGRTITVGGMIRCGILAVPFSIGVRPFAQFIGVHGVMQKFHKKYAAEPHW
jgi:hypothetical protein